MCQNLNPLTRLSHHRFVSQCEHTTIHINWDNLTLSVALKDFNRLTGLLEKAVMEVNPIKISEGHCCLVQQENGQVQLWVGDTGLLFTLSNFLSFVDLIRHAACRLKKVPPKSQITPPLRRKLFRTQYSLN